MKVFQPRYVGLTMENLFQMKRFLNIGLPSIGDIVTEKTAKNGEKKQYLKEKASQDYKKMILLHQT